MGAERSDPPATVAELEEGLRQLHRMEMQTKLQVDRVEALVAAAIKVLHRADIVHENCVYSEKDTYRCECYEKRPSICRTYDCREDKRVWEDFAAKKPATMSASHRRSCRSACRRATRSDN